MVPWWTLILLTAAFFIREMIMRSKQRPADYDSGYRQAIKDIANKWNKLYGNYEVYTFIMEMKSYIQRKLKCQ